MQLTACDKFYETSVLQSRTECRLADEWLVWNTSLEMLFWFHFIFIKTCVFRRLTYWRQAKRLHLRCDAKERVSTIATVASVTPSLELRYVSFAS